MIIVESGLVYTAGLIGELVLHILGNTGTLVIIGILSQTMVCTIIPSHFYRYTDMNRLVLMFSFDPGLRSVYLP